MTAEVAMHNPEELQTEGEEMEVRMDDALLVDRHSGPRRIRTNFYVGWKLDSFHFGVTWMLHA